MKIEINFDALTEAELLEATVVLKALSNYAYTKRYAMQLRLKGNITLALSLEKSCDELYDTLPEWARW